MRSYFSHVHPYFCQKQQLYHPKWPLHHFYNKTILLDAFRSHLVSMKCFPPFHSYTARLGRAWKSLARSYFELFSPYIGQKQDPDHPKWPWYHVNSTCRCILDYIWCLWSVSHPPKAIQRSWKDLGITREEQFCSYFHPILARYNAGPSYMTIIAPLPYS